MGLQTLNPSHTKAWLALQNHYKIMQNNSVKEMFANDSERVQKFHIQWNDFLIDFSKNNIINGAYGYINKAGKLTIMPKFEDAGVFSDGLAQVCSNGQWGYINTEGQIAIPPTFQSAAPFRDGLALASLQGKWVYINVNGEIVWKE